MPPRLKSIIVLTFIVFGLYIVFFRVENPFQSGQHAIDVLQGIGNFGGQQQEIPPTQDIPPKESQSPNGSGKGLKGTLVLTPTKSADGGRVYFSFLKEKPTGVWSAPDEVTKPSVKATANTLKPSPAAEPGKVSSLQAEYEKEYETLGKSPRAGAIYGTTLKSLFDIGAHEGFAAAALKSTEAPSVYGDTPPYAYDPYPYYNSKAWKAGHQGTHQECLGANGAIADLLVYSGHPEAFNEPQIGSYIPLDIDSNLCFERETRLGPYGFKGEVVPKEKKLEKSDEKKGNTNNTKVSLPKQSGIKPDPEEFLRKVTPVTQSDKPKETSGRLEPYVGIESFRPAVTPGTLLKPDGVTPFDLKDADKMKYFMSAAAAKMKSITPQATPASKPHQARNGKVTDWGALQKLCYQKNQNRFVKDQHQQEKQTPDPPIGGELNVVERSNKTVRGRPNTMARRLEEIAKKLLPARQGGEQPPGFQPGDFDREKEYSKEDVQSDDVPPSLGSKNEEEQEELDEAKQEAEDLLEMEQDDEDDGEVTEGDQKEEEYDLEPSQAFDGDLIDLESKPESQPSDENQSQDTPDADGEDTEPSKPLTEEEAKTQGLHGMPPTASATPAPRTAIVIRTRSNLYFTKNARQNLRAMISELSLRSGAEYEIFLLKEYKDGTLPLSSSPDLYNEAVEKSVPKEFASITVLWNDKKIQEIYPAIPKEVNNAEKSHWLSLQWFAQEHPGFEYYWNWDVDTRYTGQYYNLFEKLSSFAKAQPRKGLWERNERFYIPGHHGRWSKFVKDVEISIGDDTIWGAPTTGHVTPIGPKPPVKEAKGDNYVWGVGEDADLITLNPIFDPVGTKVPGEDEVWGYDEVKTPRRASMGTHARLSKTLLSTMHEESKKGNHVGSDMVPSTVALLHGLKAVFAPIPMYFDRPWEGAALQKYFNPGSKGEIGGVEGSAFEEGGKRFRGSTWGFGGVKGTAERLYSSWLGLEVEGIGGVEWEKKNGRVCLPPLLLHAVGDIGEIEGQGEKEGGGGGM